ncbi:MAG: RusA family crossover junction endodeoxyribonuclease [Anaerolineales bacterium]
MLFEFLIPKRPLSFQASRHNLQVWKSFVSAEASKTWVGMPHNGSNFHLTLVYLYSDAPVDVDNIIKPIQDALVGLIYDDDVLISDVESHRRSLTSIVEIAKYPDLLVEGVLSGKECVYVRVADSRPLEDYLS